MVSRHQGKHSVLLIGMSHQDCKCLTCISCMFVAYTISATGSASRKKTGDVHSRWGNIIPIPAKLNKAREWIYGQDQRLESPSSQYSQSLGTD